ncbi:MAG: hypothetical protein AB7T27_00415 [Kiritimatiellia bacterium]
MKLEWLRLDGGNWYDLQTVDLAHKHFDDLQGVYVIWQTTVTTGNVVKVGQGVIRDRLQSHREDPVIQKHNTGGLSVTWAKVDGRSVDGVERYLGDTLTPKVAHRFPDVTPIAVNLPGQA